MTVKWSDKNTKAELVEIAQNLGLQAKYSMLKSEILEALDRFKEAKMARAKQKESIKIKPEDVDRTVDSVPTGPPPGSVIKESVKLKLVRSEDQDLIKFMSDKVWSFDQLLTDWGKGNLNKTKAVIGSLRSQGKLSQARRGSKLFYKVV